MGTIMVCLFFKDPLIEGISYGKSPFFHAISPYLTVPFALPFREYSHLISSRGAVPLFLWGTDDVQIGCMEQGGIRAVTDSPDSLTASLTIFQTILSLLISLLHPFPEDLMVPILDPL